jgi:hypothetical protein
MIAIYKMHINIKKCNLLCGGQVRPNAVSTANIRQKALHKCVKHKIICRQLVIFTIKNAVCFQIQAACDKNAECEEAASGASGDDLW